MRGEFWQFVLTMKDVDFYFSTTVYKERNRALDAGYEMAETFGAKDAVQIRIRKLRVASP